MANQKTFEDMISDAVEFINQLSETPDQKTRIVRNFERTLQSVIRKRTARKIVISINQFTGEIKGEENGQPVDLEKLDIEIQALRLIEDLRK